MTTFTFKVLCVVVVYVLALAIQWVLGKFDIHVSVDSVAIAIVIGVIAKHELRMDKIEGVSPW